MFHTYYKKYGNKIFLRYKTSDSKTHNTTVTDYKPSLFIHTDEESEVKSIFNKNLKKIDFDSMKEAKEFAEKYKNVDNFSVEGNSDFANQFIIELMKGQTPDYKAENIRYCVLDIEVDSGEDGGFPEPEFYEHPITFSANYDSLTDEYTLFGLKNSAKAEWRREKAIKDIPDHLKINYIGFDTEEQLLRAMMQYFEERQFDFTSGWNSEEFDMPYLTLRAMHVLSEAYVEKMLSPFNKIDVRRKRNDFGVEYVKIDIWGLPHLDYLLLYKKHVKKPRENYKLGYIAKEDTGRTKVEYEGSLHELYMNDYQTYGDYNLVDTYLITEIEKVNGLFGLTYALAYYALANFEDTLGTVGIWEKLMSKYLFSNKKAPPYHRLNHKKSDFEGGFVYEVKKGLKEGIVSFDLKSLYPHCEMQYNIGVETHVPYDELPDELKSLKDKHTFQDLVDGTVDTSALKKYNLAMAGNFEFYRRDIPSSTAEIKRELYRERSRNKKLMLQAESDAQKAETEKEKMKFEALELLYDNMQHGLKIYLNAGYGATGNSYFLYFKLENAAAITASGRLVNKYTKKRLVEFLNKLFKTNTDYVVAGDTDSLYLDLSVLWKKLNFDDINKRVDEMDRFCRDILSPEIERICEELCDYLNAYKNEMVWNREAIAEAGFWTAKKRYALKVWDSEGVRYEKAKVKMKGLEPIKASYPIWAREELEEYVNLILEGDESKVHDRLDGTKKKFYGYDIEVIANPKGVSTIAEYTDHESEYNLYKKKTPQATRACIVHNHLLDKLKLKNIKPIKDGDKIRIINLKMPNPCGEDVIAFDGKLPKEFNLDKYVDRDSIFEVTFMSPLKTMLDSVGWHEEKIETLF